MSKKPKIIDELEKYTKFHVRKVDNEGYYIYKNETDVTHDYLFSLYEKDTSTSLYDINNPDEFLKNISPVKIETILAHYPSMRKKLKSFSNKKLVEIALEVLSENNKEHLVKKEGPLTLSLTEKAKGGVDSTYLTTFGGVVLKNFTKKGNVYKKHFDLDSDILMFKETIKLNLPEEKEKMSDEIKKVVIDGEVYVKKSTIKKILAEIDEDRKILENEINNLSILFTNILDAESRFKKSSDKLYKALYE